MSLQALKQQFFKMADSGNIVGPEPSSFAASILQGHFENFENFDQMIQISLFLIQCRRYLEGIFGHLEKRL